MKSAREAKSWRTMPYLSSALSRGRQVRAAAVALLLAAMPSAAFAAECGDDGAGFDAWLARFKRTAAAQGISAATISSALAGVTYDPTVVRLDRSQRSFKLSFDEFYARRVGPR